MESVLIQYNDEANNSYAEKILSTEWKNPQVRKWKQALMDPPNYHREKEKKKKDS